MDELIHQMNRPDRRTGPNLHLKRHQLLGSRSFYQTNPIFPSLLLNQKMTSHQLSAWEATQEHEVQCVFGVHDVNEELVVSVCHQDKEQSGLFYGGSELVGQVSILVSSVAAESNCTLPPAWYTLESPRTAKIVMIKVCALEKSRERYAVERDQEKQKEKRKVRKAKIVMIKVCAQVL
ncbi:hypothetical protein COP1_044585 [Malus domestica]